MKEDISVNDEVNNENDYKLLFSTKDCIQNIKLKIQSAKKSIDIEAYYFNPDNIGLDILELLKIKSNEGVKVRLLLDHVGSYRLDKKSVIRDLNKSNIDIRFFNSIIPFYRGKKSLLFLRNHRRSILIDGIYTFTGGFCFGDSMIHWIELGILIKNKKLNEKVKKIFNSTWNRVYYPTFKIGKTLKRDILPNDDFTYITQAPLQFQRHIYKYYLNNIKKSTKSIYLVTPYFIPDNKMLRFLRKAVQRGVDVNIILPIKSNWTIADMARNTYISSVLRYNIKIHFTERMIHSKFAIFDDRKAFIGSMNLDNLSLKYNYESGVCINNSKCIDELDLYTQNLIKNTFRIDIKSWNNRSIVLKMTEKFVWLFRKFL